MYICWFNFLLLFFLFSITGQSSNLYEFSSEELLEKIFDLIENVEIITNTEITEISHDKNKITVRDQQSNIFQCSVIILAIPWQDVKKIDFQPEIPFEFQIPLPKNINCLTSFLIEYDQSYWRKKQYSGSIFSHNPLIIGYEIKNEIYGGIIAHNQLTENNLNLIILEKLAEYFGRQMLNPSKWIEKTFIQHQVLNFPKTEPWNHIIWSSTDNATSFRGSLNGAVQCGYRAAIDALLILRPQNVNWQDIVEIQKANAVYKRSNWYQLWISSLNLYNSAFYGLIINGLAFSYFLKQKLSKMIFG